MNLDAFRGAIDPSWAERLSPLGASLLIAAAALLIGMFASFVVLSMIRRWGRRNDVTLENLLVKHLRRPLQVLAPVVTLLVALPAVIPQGELPVLRQVLSLVGVMAATWFAVGAVEVGERYLLGRYDLHGVDGARARSMQTRVRVGRNLGVVAIMVLGVAIALTTIEPVRELGTSLLASAGVAGVVIGFAAQRSIATLFAGVQMAFTEPVRIDDVVVLEGEWGRIEEITLTYVVVRLWDQRRLVVPITWFLEKPFQNWTRTDSNLLGTVDLVVHPSVSLDEIRAELDRILKASGGLWDGHAQAVQVTDIKEQTITVRVLVSASDAGRLWDLRCQVREAILGYLRTRPGGLPPVRVAAPEGEPLIFPK